jgi:hypothetical protein
VVGVRAHQVPSEAAAQITLLLVLIVAWQHTVYDAAPNPEQVDVLYNVSHAPLRAPALFPV